MSGEAFTAGIEALGLAWLAALSVLLVLWGLASVLSDRWRKP